jgi:DNA polymerase delta subunit 1
MKCNSSFNISDSVMINFRASMPNQVPNRSASTSTDASSDFVTNDADTAQMIRDAMELGTQAAKLVTDQLPAPIQLEFEKVYAPFMLFSKKRYAGLYYAANSDANRPNYMDVKGLQSVRRDSCTLLRETFDQCLNVLLRYSNIEAAREVVRRMLADMLARRVPMHSLILSRQLAKANYKGRQPHVELARRLAARDPASAPALGSRVSYVVLETGSAGKKSDLSDKVEDPLFALENDLPIDMQWYIEHQMKKPLTALFSLVLPNPNTLFSTINSGVDIVRKPAAMVHSMMRGFVQAQPRCVGCGCALSAGDAKRLCKTCAPRRESIVEPRRQQLVATEAQQKKLWQQCTACVGSSASQVVDLEDAADSLRLAKLCRNMDCHTLFERHQADRAFDRLAAELRDLES